jgi:hypothetical protein
MLKPFIKFVYTIVLPLTMTALYITALVTLSLKAWFIALITVLLIASYVNAAAFYIWMEKTTMIPNLTWERYLGCGVGCGYIKSQESAFIILPFFVCSIEWDTRSKRKRDKKHNI